LTSADTTIEWIRDPDRIRAIEQPWRKLEEAVEDRTPVSRFDYATTWYRHYCGDRAEHYGEPLVGAAWSDSELAGIAPCTIWRGTCGKVPVRRIDFAGFNAEGGEFLVPPDRAELVGDFLESARRDVRFDLLCLNGLDPDGEERRVLKEIAASEGMPAGEVAYRYAVVDLHDGFDAYCRSMSRNFRRNLQRAEKKVEAAGTPEVEHISAVDDRTRLDGYLDRMFAIADASWKTRETGLMAEHHRAFYRETIALFSERDEADLAILTIDGRDAAFIVALVERDTYFDFTISFSDEFAAVSPGIYLMLQVLKRLPEAGIKRVVSYGDHPYKLRWASGWVPRVRLSLFGRGPRARLARLAKFEIGPRMAWLKRRKR